MKKMFLLISMAAAFATASAITPLWLRDAQISPDGKNIAFCYRGDIYTVATTGGEARRITATSDYEANPIWSPDSKQIAYASDKHGNFDIFIVPATGGIPLRLTTYSAAETPEAFSTDGKYVIYSASIQDPA